jgi:hypothetical protein
MARKEAEPMLQAENGILKEALVELTLGRSPMGIWIFIAEIIMLWFSSCSLLKAARPERFPCKVLAGPGVLPSSLF